MSVALKRKNSEHPQQTPSKPTEQKGKSHFSDLGTRLVASLVMVSLQTGLILGGYQILFFELLILQIFAFRELIKLTENPEDHKLLGFGGRVFPYLLLLGVSLYPNYQHILEILKLPSSLIRYQPFVSYTILVVALLLYVINLTPQNDKYCYKRFGYSLCGSVIIGISFSLFASVAKISLTWFIIPISYVILNDSSAYFCGRIFGRHPLIKLSPKKTVEGFVGAMICTVSLSFFIPKLFAKAPMLYCSSVQPYEFHVNCELPEVFIIKEYHFQNFTIRAMPIQFHSVIIAIFASLIAPFGGFFASGFKRALSIKDFSNLIPGHGGILDRIDCQIVMGTFIYVYLKSFVF